MYLYNKIIDTNATIACMENPLNEKIAIVKKLATKNDDVTDKARFRLTPQIKRHTIKGKNEIYDINASILILIFY